MQSLRESFEHKRLAVKGTQEESNINLVYGIAGTGGDYPEPLSNYLDVSLIHYYSTVYLHWKKIETGNVRFLFFNSR